jgi:hypothetical protein
VRVVAGRVVRRSICVPNAQTAAASKASPTA